MSSVAVDYLKKWLRLTLGKTARKEFQDLYRSLAGFPWLQYGQQYKELQNNVIRPPRKHAPLRYYIPLPLFISPPDLHPHHRPITIVFTKRKQRWFQVAYNIPRYILNKENSLIEISSPVSLRKSDMVTSKIALKRVFGRFHFLYKICMTVPNSL